MWGTGERDGDIRSTEVISVGVEIMYRDPIAFAKQDPGWFDFIIDVLTE